MRILLATYWHLPHVGGVSTYIGTLCDRLEQAGHTVEIFAQHPDLSKYYLMRSGQQVKKSDFLQQVEAAVRHGYKARQMQVTPWIVWRETEKYTLATAWRQVGLDSYDLIHTQDIFSTFAGSRVKPAHIPLVATIHGCLATEWVANGEIRMRTSAEQEYLAMEERYGALPADSLILPSRWLADRLAAFQVSHPRTHIIPYGLDLHQFEAKAQAKQEVPAAPGRKVIVCPARLVAIKGHTCLLRALAMLVQKQRDIVCWLIGDGVMRKELECLADELGLGEHVQFLGDRSDVPALINRADLVVLPSLQDNFPFAVMEAQALGKPVVASRVGGIAEMIEDGKNGLLVDPGNSQDLCEKMSLVLNNDSLHQRLSHEAKERARADWQAARMVERTLRVYEEAIGDRSARAKPCDRPPEVPVPDPQFAAEWRQRWGRLAAEREHLSPRTARLHGKVSGAGGRFPVLNASVHLLDVTGVVLRSVPTNRRGEYAIEQVQPGNYALICSAGADGTHTQKIAVEADRHLQVDFRLAAGRRETGE